MKKLMAIAVAIVLLLVMAVSTPVAADSDTWITTPGTYSGLAIDGDLYVAVSPAYPALPFTVKITNSTIDGNIIVQVDNLQRNKVIIENSTINGNIEVISCNVLDIGPGNTIDGNVEIGSGAHDIWVYQNPSINGNVEAKGASSVVVMGNTINSNIELTGCANPANPGPGNADIWGNVVDGNIEIKNSPGYVVAGNTVTGDVEIEP